MLRRVQAERVDAMAHEYLGLGDIQRAVGRGQLFDSLYVLQNFLDDDTFTDMETEHGIVGDDAVDATHYPLTWVATPGRAAAGAAGVPARRGDDRARRRRCWPASPRCC